MTPRNCKVKIYIRVDACVRCEPGQIRYSALYGRSTCQWLRLLRYRQDRHKGTDKETNGGRRIYALVRWFLFAFSGDAAITNNSTLSVNYGRFVRCSLEFTSWQLRALLIVKKLLFFSFLALSKIFFFCEIICHYITKKKLLGLVIFQIDWKTTISARNYHFMKLIHLNEYI